MLRRFPQQNRGDSLGNLIEKIRTASQSHILNYAVEWVSPHRMIESSQGFWRVSVSTVLAIPLFISCLYSNTRISDTNAQGADKVPDRRASAETVESGVDTDKSAANHKQLLANLKQARNTLYFAANAGLTCSPG